MDFQNPQVSPNELPSLEDVSFLPLEKEFLLVERISVLISMGIFLVIGLTVFYLVDGLRQPIFMMMASLLFLFLFLWTFISKTLNYKFSGFALRERDLIFKSGWLYRKVRVVVRNRIQHVSVQSGPLERKFGLSSVSIFTAGSSEADFTIKGITQQTALGIKDWVSKDIDGNLTS